MCDHRHLTKLNSEPVKLRDDDTEFAFEANMQYCVDCGYAYGRVVGSLSVTPFTFEGDNQEQALARAKRRVAKQLRLAEESSIT